MPFLNNVQHFKYKAPEGVPDVGNPLEGLLKQGNAVIEDDQRLKYFTLMDGT